ncbi:hypothetical protein [Xanthomonas phage JGB6]|nr:hypothetical protein [Xanthomonas phage JGB6]
MPTAPVLIYSDPHYHNFAAFSGLHNGINTRLLSTIRATEEAVAALQAAGGHKIICAGDMFHVRGQITPSVMNPVINMIEHFPHDTQFSVISGNHDLETERTSEAMSSITALGGVEMLGGHYLALFLSPFRKA